MCRTQVRALAVIMLVAAVAVTVSVPVTDAHAMDAITGSTTWGTVIEEHSGTRLHLRNIIGDAVWDYQYVKLDGEANSISVDLPGISQEFNLTNGQGYTSVSLGVISFGVASEGFAFFKRNYVFIKGTAGGLSVELQLDYEPGMGAITTASAKEEVPPTRCRVVVVNPKSGKRVVFDDYVQ